MKKRSINNILTLMLILVGSALCARLIAKQERVILILPSLLILFFLFHLVVRNLFSFKPYFLSKWNIFSSKFSKEFEIDIPKELAYDKILEIIAESPFNLKYANKTDFEIFVTTNLSWRSWGENIYMHLTDSGHKTIIRFDSSALFQMYTWGKNEHNFDEFLQRLDDSLTV